MNEIHRKNILILDPERDIGELFARALESRRDCKCYLTSRQEEVVDLLKDISFDLLLLDLGTAGAEDFKLLRKIKSLYPRLILVIDAYLHQKEQATRALSLGAHGYIIKPIKIDAFRKKIDEFTLQVPARVL